MSGREVSEAEMRRIEREAEQRSATTSPAPPLPPPMEHVYVKRGIGAGPVVIVFLGMVVLAILHLAGAL